MGGQQVRHHVVAPGEAWAAGASGFAGAFYSVQTYTETIGVGAIATAACDPNDASNSQNYVAISGGVQDTDSGTDMTTNDNQVAIAASFPGRMDFSTFTPKPFRLDGWIVQFAHVGQQDNNLAVWALCVPVSDFGGRHPRSHQLGRSRMVHGPASAASCPATIERWPRRRPRPTSPT